jgi:hypothetical protein
MTEWRGFGGRTASASARMGRCSVTEEERTMAEDKKTGKKMEESDKEKDKGGKAEEGTEQQSGEVEGRQAFLYMYCWNDMALNRIPAHWRWFYCWRCGALNRVW